jgi:hypothetical protein
MSPAMITEVMVLSTRLGQLAESTEAPLSDIIQFSTFSATKSHRPAGEIMAVSSRNLRSFSFDILDCSGTRQLRNCCHIHNRLHDPGLEQRELDSTRTSGFWIDGAQKYLASLSRERVNATAVAEAEPAGSDPQKYKHRRYRML